MLQRGEPFLACSSPRLLAFSGAVLEARAELHGAHLLLGPGMKSLEQALPPPPVRVSAAVRPGLATVRFKGRALAAHVKRQGYKWNAAC